jgi:hypothetical protein
MISDRAIVAVVNKKRTYIGLGGVPNKFEWLFPTP